MKVIFLDFDGVLNSKEYVTSDRHPKGCGIGLDPFAVARLRRLVHETGAKIVVTSAWRTGRSLDNLSGLLQAGGCHLEVMDRTRDFGSRGDEIRAWITCNQPYMEAFVVIDDDVIDGFEETQIKTDFESGLQDHHVDAAIRILGGSNG